jgi:hypothetical protein
MQQKNTSNLKNVAGFGRHSKDHVCRLVTASKQQKFGARFSSYISPYR